MKALRLGTAPLPRFSVAGSWERAWTAAKAAMNVYGRAPRAQNWLGIMLIGAVLLGFGGFALAGVLLRAPPVDEELCRTDQPLAAHTIILIDTSDRRERRHKRQLEAAAAQERARLGQFDRLTPSCA